MSVPIPSHEIKRATGLNHWKEGRGCLGGGLYLRLALHEELVPLGFVKAWVMEAEENFVGPLDYVEIVLRENFF